MKIQIDSHRCKEGKKIFFPPIHRIMVWAEIKPSKSEMRSDRSVSDEIKRYSSRSLKHVHGQVTSWVLSFLIAGMLYLIILTKLNVIGTCTCELRREVLTSLFTTVLK